MPPKIKHILSEEHLGMLTSALAEAGDTEVEVDNSNMSSLISSLLVAFLSVKKRLDDALGAAAAGAQLDKSEGEGGQRMAGGCGQQRLRTVEDELDEMQQRSLKGNLMLTSRDIAANPSRGNPAVKSVLRSDEELGDTPLLDHVLDLVKDKYKVSVPQADVQACHRLPHGAVILRIWNRRPGSAWSKLSQAIKSKPVNPKLNFYANFHLTSRRRNLTFLVRQLKRTERISQYYTDENGSISIKVKETDRKQMITFHREGKIRSTVLTMTEEELEAFIVSANK